jgi:hypothetical protein
MKGQQNYPSPNNEIIFVGKATRIMRPDYEIESDIKEGKFDLSLRKVRAEKALVQLS